MLKVGYQIRGSLTPKCMRSLLFNARAIITTACKVHYSKHNQEGVD
jgi:hypothetical protein